MAMRIKEYYKNTNVVARMTEFLGGSSLEEATCVYVTRSLELPDYSTFTKPPQELRFFLDRGLDVSRSLWDEESLIAHVDIEYVNFDFSAEPYLRPLRAFSLQRPVETAVEKILLEYGIAPLHLLSGRGHHFLWTVKRGTPAFASLRRLGRMPPHLKHRYLSPNFLPHKPLDIDLGAAFAGLGLILEYLAHRFKKEACSASEIPVELTAVRVGTQQCGSEVVSIDISEYGDPLDTRRIRIPFSAYYKSCLGNDGSDFSVRSPILFSIPLHECDRSQGVNLMRDESAVAELAARASVQIPEQSKPMESLITAYENSVLARFHDWFYSEDHEPSDRWPETYDRIRLADYPACIRHIFEHPNDLLLKPVTLRQVVRVMRAKGWHPRHIAGLLRSKYERDHGWGRAWFVYDAATRSDFYTRIFAGLLACGHDALSDFNCPSMKAIGLCGDSTHDCSLTDLRESLNTRPNYE
jgi:hypothetical protein